MIAPPGAVVVSVSAAIDGGRGALLSQLYSHAKNKDASPRYHFYKGLGANRRGLVARGNDLCLRSQANIVLRERCGRGG